MRFYLMTDPLYPDKIIVMVVKADLVQMLAK